MRPSPSKFAGSASWSAMSWSSMTGAQPPAGFKAREFEKSTTEKDRIVQDLNQSWDFANKTINSMSMCSAKVLPKLGPQANEGDVVYIVADAHEHLGQLIAYARRMASSPLGRCKRRKKGNG